MSDKYDVYDNQGRKVGSLERPTDFSGCAVMLAGIVIVVAIIIFLFIISPLAIGLWLVISLFTTGWKKETQILTAVWVALCLVVPSVYYMGWMSFVDDSIPWLGDIIWIYYVFAALALAIILFWGIYKVGIAILSNPNKNSLDNESKTSTKIIVGGAVTILFLCCACLSLGAFIYLNNY